MEASLVHTCPDTSKIDPFNGTFFKRWQERVFSIIDVVNLEHILIDPKPEDGSHLLPTKKTGKTSYELWKGYAPNIAYLKVWGCLAKLLLLELKKQKLGPKTFDAMLVSSGAPLNLPDIAYAIGRLSRYTQSPNQDHWTAVRRVLKYLRGTINYGLCFCGFPSVLEGFSDANWISNLDEMKSTSGYVFICGGSAISWKSAKQTCIT
ncbi:Retrovirus-related Pol polyprotein from transposon TNT 1-94 [Vitis vinifera]|uniref:Retrovirus-related Pol polyprotein from transposon TNT 1-94 n=1 Tax=Vitis vinifera TaxID=29760 RepID=A0A438EHF6_VITVI|nr:Retrovirus-related Pol polyprotein from transposon TNT 1-94 [Vitis vinifera]